MINSRLLLAGSLAAVTIFLSSCGDGSKGVGAGKTDSLSSFTSQLQYNGAIAFIRMDSMMVNYGMYIDMSDEFAKKQQKAEADVNGRGRALERSVAEYQEKAQKGLLTRFQMTSMEEDLQKKQQGFMAYRDKVMADLAKQEQDMSNGIAESIMAYVKEYNADKKYSMILTTSGVSPVIVADPNLDITREILSELNKRYLEKKEAEGKKK